MNVNTNINFVTLVLIKNKVSQLLGIDILIKYKSKGEVNNFSEKITKNNIKNPNANSEVEN
jgi:hypothetical protein